MSGKILDGRYELLEPLGSGGMARVFRGRDLQLQRSVAIKLLPEDRADDEHLRARLTREAQAMARLNHPHVVQVYGSASPTSPTPYLVTELVVGTDLADALLENGSMPWELALWIVERCLSGLAAIHATHVIHRDIKPSNILITRDGAPKIADLGVAKLNDRTGITAIGARPGTLAYMPPEAYEFAKPTPQLDLYAMGCVLYELIAGVPPYEAEGTTALVGMIRKGARQKLSNRIPDASPGVCAIVERAMALDPKDRFASAEEMRAACRALLEPALATDLAHVAKGWVEDPSERDWIDELRDRAAKFAKSAPTADVPAAPVAEPSRAPETRAKPVQPPIYAGWQGLVAAFIAAVLAAGWISSPDDKPPVPPAPRSVPAPAPAASIAKPAVDVAAQTESARELLFSGSYAAAEAKLQPVLAAAPDDIEALQLMASIRLAAQEPARALESIQRASALDPKNLEVLDLFVEIELARHDYAHAEELARALVKAKPKHVGYLTKLATVLCSAGKGGEAATVVQRALALKPGLEQLKELRDILDQPCK